MSLRSAVESLRDDLRAEARTRTATASRPGLREILPSEGGDVDSYHRGGVEVLSRAADRLDTLLDQEQGGRCGECEGRGKVIYKDDRTTPSLSPRRAGHGTGQGQDSGKDSAPLRRVEEPFRASLDFTFTAYGLDAAETLFEWATEAVEKATAGNVEGGFVEQMDRADVIEGSPLDAALGSDPSERSGGFRTTVTCGRCGVQRLPDRPCQKCGGSTPPQPRGEGATQTPSPDPPVHPQPEVSRDEEKNSTTTTSPPEGVSEDGTVPGKQRGDETARPSGNPPTDSVLADPQPEGER